MARFKVTVRDSDRRSRLPLARKMKKESETQNKAVNRRATPVSSNANAMSNVQPAGASSQPAGASSQAAGANLSPMTQNHPYQIVNKESKTRYEVVNRPATSVIPNTNAMSNVQIAGPSSQPAGPSSQPAGPSSQPAGPSSQPAGANLLQNNNPNQILKEHINLSINVTPRQDGGETSTRGNDRRHFKINISSSGYTVKISYKKSSSKVAVLENQNATPQLRPDVKQEPEPWHMTEDENGQYFTGSIGRLEMHEI